MSSLQHVQRPLLSFGPKTSMKLSTCPVNVCKVVKIFVIILLLVTVAEHENQILSLSCMSGRKFGWVLSWLVILAMRVLQWQLTVPLVQLGLGIYKSQQVLRFSVKRLDLAAALMFPNSSHNQPQFLDLFCKFWVHLIYSVQLPGSCMAGKVALCFQICLYKLRLH